MKSTVLALSLTVLALFTGACRTADGETPAEKRDFVRQRSGEVLTQLYEDAPHAKSAVESAVGYATFSNFGMKLFIVGSNNGYGMAVNNDTKAETFMRLVQLEGGLGLGAKSYSVVFIFETDEALRGFTDDGWEFGGDVEASAQHDDSGGALEGATTVGPGIRMFQMTETGLSLQATVGGSKYYKDDDLYDEVDQ